jgi:acetoacetyl-CoA synthetase
MSGGTDVATAFVGGVPVLPVLAGRIQAPCLGVAAAAFDDAGKPLLGEDGELVVTRPLPSMPLFLWADEDGERYRSSYFDLFPGIWRQGDQITFYPDMSCVISGRSDATLNRNGIRIGTAEVYHSVAAVAGVVDCLIVNVDIAGSTESWMPLFVVLQQGYTLDPGLEAQIRQRLREDCSPRHVPDAIVPVAAIPYTLSGKRLEVPVKRLLMGWPLERAVNVGAVANPEALTPFIELGQSRAG